MKYVTLGRDIQTGEVVTLSEEARYLSLYILGKTGTGKSNLLAQIACQDIGNGDGLCLLDPHDDLAAYVLARVPYHRVDDVILLDPTDVERPFGLNPFACLEPHNFLKVTSTADNFIAALGGLAEFADIFASAPRMKNVLHHMALTFVVNQGHTLAEAPEFLSNADFRLRFYDALRPDHLPVLRFWERLDERPKREQRDMVESSLNKLERFQSNPLMRAIFGQPTSIDFRSAMDEGKIIIVKLNRRDIGEDNAAFIGAFIVWDILQAALSRSNIPEYERRPFHLIADEFQTFMTTAFPTLQKESRKFRVDTTVAHQERTTLNDAARAATLVVRNKVVFEVIGRDAEELVSEFKINVPEPATERFEPTYELVPGVMEHLKTHGHANSNVISYFRSILGDLNDIYQDADRLLKYRSSGPDPIAPAFDLSFYRQAFLLAIDAFLYEAMRSGVEPQSEFNTLDWGSRDKLKVKNRSRRMVAKHIDKVYEEVLTPVSVSTLWKAMHIIREKHWEEMAHGEVLSLGQEAIEREYLPPEMAGEDPRKWGDVFYRSFQEGKLSAERYDEMHARLKALEAAHPFEAPTFGFLTQYEDCPGYEPSKHADWNVASQMLLVEDVLAVTIADLAIRLRKSPCYAHTGQLEPVLDKPRLYSDVEAQMVNELTTLPAFTAKCKIVEEDAPREYMIRTFPPDALPRDSAERIKKIQARSRLRYGRDRREVEEEINRRLALSDEAVSEPVDDLDDPKDFGEKKTRTTSK